MKVFSFFIQRLQGFKEEDKVLTINLIRAMEN